MENIFFLAFAPCSSGLTLSVRFTALTQKFLVSAVLIEIFSLNLAILQPSRRFSKLLENRIKTLFYVILTKSF